MWEWWRASEEYEPRRPIGKWLWSVSETALLEVPLRGLGSNSRVPGERQRMFRLELFSPDLQSFRAVGRFRNSKSTHMASCNYCGAAILFGGTQVGHLRFCTDRCAQQGGLLQIADQVPPDLLREEVAEVHSGNCPKCRRPGPVDVHTSYSVWSALVITRWSSIPKMCCRACAVKSHLGHALLSLCFGWWGFPWGLIFTPVQVVRNIIAIFGGPDPTKPSPQLVNFVRIQLAARLVAYQREQAKIPPPLPVQSPPVPSDLY